jgi:hypothetical protein
MTPKEYAKVNGISYYKALKYYKKNGLALEGSGGKNRTVERNFFDFNAPKWQYWIGYIAADGNVAKNCNNISITSKDIDHLNKYAKELDCPFYIKNGKSIAQFANKSSKEYLVQLGITPNKSKTLKFLGDFTSHFVRGVFDGDGSVSNGRPKITSGSSQFIAQLSTLFDSKGWKYSIRSKGKDSNCFDIELIGDSRWYFMEWIYKDAEIYLERKYFKMVAYFEKSKYANRVNSGKAEMPILSQATQECVEGATTNSIPPDR